MHAELMSVLRPKERSARRRSKPLDLELLDLTNKLRYQHKLCPLKWHKDLASTAKRHAEKVAEGSAPFSHQGAPERFRDACGGSYINIGENLARSDGYCREDLPGTAVAGWYDSEGHRRNLLGPFDACGIGWAASDSGTIYVTQLLALLEKDKSLYGRWKSFHGLAQEVATGAVASTPTVCAAVGLVLAGPMLAVTGGIVGGALDYKYGIKASSVPQMLRSKANGWLCPTVCSNCGAACSNGNELYASSDSERSQHLLCEHCHPSPNGDDVWCYVD